MSLAHSPSPSTVMAPPKIGLVLSGGGARAAYQVGVLQAIASFLPKQSPVPFKVICGTSAGGINAAALAVNADDFRRGVAQLVRVWRGLHVEQIYHSDFPALSGQMLHWLASFFAGGLGRYNPRSLLDNQPLRELLQVMLAFKRMDSMITQGHLHALAITASGFASGQSVSFFQGHAALQPWVRAKRVGARTRLNVNHLMASSAIPFLFPAVRLNREYFCDGSIRQTAPISPALHLGAEKVLVLGVNALDDDELPNRVRMQNYPSLAQVTGHLMNSIFNDSLDVDLERLTRINRTLSLIPDEIRQSGALSLKPVEVLALGPSQKIEAIAARHVQAFPITMRFLLRGLGAMGRRGAVLASYLLFEAEYTQDLIALGWQDAMHRKTDILQFLAGATPIATEEIR